MGSPTQLVKDVVGRGGSASLRLRLCCNPLGEPLPTRLCLCTGVRQVNRLTSPTIRLISLIREHETQLPRTIVPRYSNVHLRMRLACSRAGTPARRYHRLLAPRSLRRNPHLRRLPHRYRLPLPLPQITNEVFFRFLF